MKGLGDMKWLQYMSEDQKQLIRKSEFLKKRETVEVRKLMTLLLNNSKALLTRYNQVEILNNGEETFPALFGALKNAKKFIHLEYYIIGEGRLATELKEILLQKLPKESKSGSSTMMWDHGACPRSLSGN